MTLPTDIDRFEIGELVRFSVTIKDKETDALLDPGGLTFQWRYDDDDTAQIKTYVTDPEIVRDSLGTFHIDLETTKSGLLHIRWKSTDPGTGSAEKDVEILRSNVLQA